MQTKKSKSQHGFSTLGAMLIIAALLITVIAVFSFASSPPHKPGIDRAAPVDVVQLSSTVKVFVLTVDGQRVVVMENSKGGGAVGLIGPDTKVHTKN